MGAMHVGCPVVGPGRCRPLSLMTSPPAIVPAVCVRFHRPQVVGGCELLRVAQRKVDRKNSPHHGGGELGQWNKVIKKQSPNLCRGKLGNCRAMPRLGYAIYSIRLRYGCANFTT